MEVTLKTVGCVFEPMITWSDSETTPGPPRFNIHGHENRSAR